MAETASHIRSDEYVVRTKDLKKHYRMGDETIEALKGVTLDIFRGEYISLMGPSGSGKSTLFNMIGAGHAVAGRGPCRVPQFR